MGALRKMSRTVLADLDREEPGWFEVFCARVAEGGNVPKLLEEICVTWGVFWQWLDEAEGRRGLYEGAMAARAAYRKEKTVANVMDIAHRSHVRKKVSVNDTLKAAALVMGDEGGGGISVGGGRVRIAVEFVPAGRVIEGELG